MRSVNFQNLNVMSGFRKVELREPAAGDRGRIVALARGGERKRECPRKVQL